MLRAVKNVLWKHHITNKELPGDIAALTTTTTTMLALNQVNFMATIATEAKTK